MTARESEVTLEDLRSQALELLSGVDDGDPLDRMTAELIALGVRVSVTALDVDGTRLHAERALDAGATPDQVHETLILVSGIGFHSLMEGSRRVAELLRGRGERLLTEPLDARRRELWQRHVAGDSYWGQMELEVPGFLDALLRLSPEGFEGFIAYSAVPWKTRALRATTKELIALATNATPSHRYLAGIRLHLVNAIRLGVSRTAVLQALDIAAAGPPHGGVR
jgi:alkylhydroperoxidase/carboxymuconolactone decarboxylase family protein YurZ